MGPLVMTLFFESITKNVKPSGLPFIEGPHPAPLVVISSPLPVPPDSGSNPQDATKSKKVIMQTNLQVASRQFVKNSLILSKLLDNSSGRLQMKFNTSLL